MLGTPKRANWSKRDSNLLRSMYIAGRSMKYLVSVFNLTKVSQIYSKLSHIGICSDTKCREERMLNLRKKLEEQRLQVLRAMAKIRERQAKWSQK